MLQNAHICPRSDFYPLGHTEDRKNEERINQGEFSKCGEFPELHFLGFA